MSQYIGGRLFSDAGQLQTVDGSGGVSNAKYPAGMFPGWACDSTDKSYVYDLVASAVPAGAVFINGVAFTQAGVMYVSSDTPAASDVSINGFKVRQDGAVRASASAVGATDAFIGGWAVAQTGAVRMSLSDITAPTLSAPSSGTPTTDGCTGAGVTTNEGNGTLYWAVVTNGGSCTDAQLKAGSGGNIVAGKAGNQAVSATGAQAISTITGLTSATTYQIKYLQRDAAGNDSSQASVSLTTSAAITYATLNPADCGASIALSGGDLIATKSGAGWNSVRANLGKATGKWYWEFTYTTKPGSANGMAAVSDAATSTASYLGNSAASYGYNASLGQKYNSGAGAGYGNTWTVGDVIGVALDMDNGKVWFSKNGTWQNAGDPAAGTNAAYTGLAGTVYPGVSLINAGDVFTLNFGASAFVGSPPAGFNSGVY